VSDRLLVILIASWSLFSGCVDTKQAAQADSNSVLRQQESDHEVHGEVGVMYGHTARYSRPFSADTTTSSFYLVFA
jgi:hypothetical protein